MAAIRKLSLSAHTQIASMLLRLALHSIFATSSAHRFVILTWVDLLLNCALASSTDPPSDATPHWLPLLNAQAILIDGLLLEHRKGIRHGAVTDVRRCIRRNTHAIPSYLVALSSSATSTTPAYRNAVLLGIVVDVALRLKKKGSNGHEVVALHKDRIIKFYLTGVISSKTPVSVPAMEALHDFLKESVARGDFEKEFLPVLERMMLRAPEIVLKALTRLVSVLSFDISKIFEAHLLEPLLSHLRATSEVVRTDAMTLWKTISSAAKQSTSLVSVVADVSKLLTSGKVSSWEHRVILYQALASLNANAHVDVSKKAAEGYLAMITKEANETAMAAAIEGLGAHLGVLIASHDTADVKDVVEKAVKVAVDGLASSKVGARKSWADVVGTIVWDHGASLSPSETLRTQAPRFLTPLLATFEKIAANPLAWKDGPLEGYVAVAIISGRIRSWADKSTLDLLKSKKYTTSILTTQPKPSLLLWDRVYTKVTDELEVRWLVRAMEAVLLGEQLVDIEKGKATVAIATGLVWLATSAPGHHARRATYETLKRCTKSEPVKVGTVMREGLAKWLLDLEKQTKDSTAITAATAANLEPDLAAYRLSTVLAGITTFADDTPKEVKERELVELTVLAHHPLVVSPTDKYNWITLAQRAGADPGKLVESHEARMKELIKDDIRDGYESELFYKAATNAISTLTFVSPEIVIPAFLELARSDLDAKNMAGIGALEVGIWKTPEGQVFVDVLKRNQKSTVEDRNRKGYAEEKWEREIREQIAKKKGTDASKNQKLTKDEQATLDTQIAKEAGIRKHVQQVHEKLVRGLQIVRAMVAGGKEALEQRLVELVRILLAVAVKRAGVLVEEDIVDTYLELGKCASDRIESIREPLGLATLRGLKIYPIPERWEEEPLDHLVTRVLYRLRSVTERQPLGPASFSYCFPVLNQVIVEGGVGCDEKTPLGKENAMEQVVIAVDIVGFHALQGDSPLLPRKEMVASLLMIIKEYPKSAKTAKATLATLCEAMSETATLDEINALFAGLLSGEPLVRVAALQALDFLDLTDIDFSRELWIACHDDDEVNAKLANQLWRDNGMDVDEFYKDPLLELVVHETASVRVSAGKAVASAVQEFPDTIVDTLESIYKIYKELARPLLPEYDEFGMVIASTLSRKDPWESRIGLALVLKELARHIRPSELQHFTEFLIKGEALGDRNEDVRHRMLDAGLAVINTHGKTNVAQLLPVFKGYLDTPATNNETHDRIRESVVILFGSVAGYLDEGDPKIRDAVDKLIETLKTPSESVQSAVGECLPPLIKKVHNDVPKLVENLLEMLFKSEKYAERRGAAYGLAGVVKGRGISALKECNIMTALKDATENKKSYQYRQGALFAYETLSAALGRLFEPYVIQILPLLLVCFGDSIPDVREATSEASRVIMSKISGHCVKLIMPSLLAGLEDRQWRTKKGSVELLGSMAFCAPKQLSISLPTIVPRLTNVLTDSHAQVTAAANQSLLLFGEVINNPEIQQLVPILLDALSDPNAHTKPALTALLETAFVHYIDAPSLALVMPILERGLKERSTEIKTKSSQIVGNMSSLTDQKDLIPYLPRLMPGLKEVLVDPVPEARATAAKALGSLVEKLGEQNFPNIVDELVLTLKTDTGGVDRQGAAQGLSEVLAGLGLERLEGLLPDIIANADSPKAYVREGFISLLIYLPATFGPRFQPYLGRIIPPILMGLADESEYVRDASLRAGRMIVINYATKAVDLLLPELEKGLFDDNWRIRQSSVQLMGDLLFRITGTSIKSAIELNDTTDIVGDDGAEVEEEETGATEANKKALLEILGKDRRDRVLSALYIVRQDISGIVRQASLTVWKAIVSNTPRMLKEILPVMMTMIIRNVASSSYDRRTVAARTLGDLVRKLGESVLAEIIPMLEDGLDSPDANTRQGVSIALSEIMATAGRVQVNDYADNIIPAVRKALCDSSSDVREAAAQAFDTLHQNVGPKAIDEILPTLLNSLQSTDDSSIYALEALKEIMAVRANVVFPVLIPTLITVPISAFNARALASLVTVAGAALNRRLTTIVGALMESLSQTTDPETLEQLRETTRALLLSIDNADGLHTLMAMLFEFVKSDDPTKRAGACDIVNTFYSESKLDASRYIGDWIRLLVALLDDRQQIVVVAAWGALNAVTKSVKKDDLEQLVGPVRRAVKSVGVAGVDLPGFCLPKGISPVLPIFLQGLMYGTTEVREQSALGIGDLIQRTSAESLKPFVTQITGPLIRIIGDRYPPQVKAAILQTLSLLLSKVPAHLKPFLPQLQRTFIKSLTDPSSTVVRSRAASALGILISLQTRVDPLVAELVSGIKTSEPGVKETMLNALESVVAKAGEGMGDVSKKGVLSVIVDGLSDDSNEGTCIGAARLLGSLCKALSVDEARPIVSAHVLSADGSSYGSLLAINAIIAEAPSLFSDLGITGDVVGKIIASSTSDKPYIPETAILAAGKLLLTEKYQTEDVTTKLVEGLANQIGQTNVGSGESKRMALVVVRAVGRKYPELLEKHLAILIPPMMSCVRDRNIPVKLTGERALLYTLQLLSGESLLQKYLSTVDSTTAKQITDYHRRILSKLVQQETQRLELLHGGVDQEAEEEDSEVWSVGNIQMFEDGKEDAE
ncbi:hypothetical protein BC938DRAFT_478212 [Jimgerdemannia flammicorona]|uniref:eIF-2-alpha kinase activator GCN1 n=1 Tax=Jimgerdemannia flammicorona TaxID=994334 RepID=A0A433QNA6_9FUNG|nr:hypothetical protein BC938DRAFT_478212 [Jimgerdemannia flammicorona]